MRPLHPRRHLGRCHWKAIGSGSASVFKGHAGRPDGALHPTTEGEGLTEVQFLVRDSGLACIAPGGLPLPRISMLFSGFSWQARLAGPTGLLVSPWLA